MKQLVVGPILGFRGLTENDEEAVWHTSALIVVPADAEEPKLSYAADSEGWKEADRCEKLADLPDGARAYRFEWSVPQKQEQDRKVQYDLGDWGKYAYYVPARDRGPRIAYGSCAGFHNPLEMQDIKGKTNALWDNIAHQHEEAAYHLMIMGGDQVYADGLWDTDRIPLLNTWLQKSLDEKRKEKLEEGTVSQLSYHYYQLYRDNWSQEEVRKVMAQVPSLMMWDDHDIFDGWGSRSEALQDTYVYKRIYSVAREYFLLFQLQARSDNVSQRQWCSSALKMRGAN